MIDHYDWSGGREAMIRLGPDDGPVVIVALPLFEEANRTRTFAVTIMRALAQRGVASVLPDLPGTGESLVATEDATLLMMREAHEGLVLHFDASGRQTYAVGLRSGALIDAFSLMFGRWHLSPQSGGDLLRELVRMKNAEVGRAERYDVHTIIGAEGDPIIIAGNRISSAMLADISGASPFDHAEIPRRVLRMDSDARPADRKINGAPLWRRAEPDNDPALAETLADDIAAWVRSCAG
ncbi:hypothetical protein M9980_06180 [Sphingomonas donggukensis]|uniref:Alpha/beta hydrolase n=1 Tax=Sphingomonas donggukensis TaxID=2949093 RepID=A0ABY4TZ03_9SPHN|nr:hypothetical protein [Sphingomonas donggukensis]URW76782.1 hypothetical protein M9980_06180 [Sphingomonas donggukensis]